MTTETTAITVGTRVLISKGCKAFDLPKGVSAQVISITELGAEYSHRVSVQLKFLNGFKAGKTMTLEARHRNRLSDHEIRLNRGNPIQNIEIIRKLKTGQNH